MDEIQLEGTWEFDSEVTDAFEEMLARSIPQYGVMRSTVSRLASRFLVRRPAREGVLLDLGASRGEALEGVRAIAGAHGRYYALEVSQPMLEALRHRYPVEAKESHGVHVKEFDLRRRLAAAEVPPADVTLSILTLQFTPIEYRHRILRDVYRATRPGGALLLVEKVLGATADLDELMVDHYLALKGENGYSPEAIERKRLALEGVLVPVTARMNEEFLAAAGFTAVDVFWRWMNFTGWIGVKEP